MRITFNPVNKNTISSIRIYITDGKRRIVDLNGADTAFSANLEKANKMKSYEFSRYYNPRIGHVVSYCHKCEQETPQSLVLRFLPVVLDVPLEI